MKANTRKTHATVTSTASADIAAPTNQIMHTHLEPHTNTTTSTATVTLTPAEESLQIHKAQRALQDLEDREDWQTDFTLALSRKHNPKIKIDPWPSLDRRFWNLRNGFSVHFRCFEVRADFSPRHRARFDAEGFLTLDGDDEHPDYWWVFYSCKEFDRASAILEMTGFLEKRVLGPDPQAPEYFICSIRLRADKIVELLKEVAPDKYAGLKF